MNSANRSLYQGFLPTQAKGKAFVWKYSPVNWGRRPRHFHIEPELNLIASGSATFGVGESVVRASQGDLLAFPPAQDHILLEASPDLYLFAIGMDPIFSSEVLRDDRDDVTIPLHVRLSEEDFRSLVGRASAIVDRTGVDQPCAELWEQAHWLGKRCTTRRQRNMHVLARWALSAVSRTPGLGLEPISAGMGAPACEVSRYFHRDVRMTFVRYRTRLRLLHFIRLMDTTRTTLVAAAEASGFGSYSQCHRIFQAELGCSPRHFFFSGFRQRMEQAYDP